MVHWVVAFVTKPDDPSITLGTKEMTPANYLLISTMCPAFPNKANKCNKNFKNIF